MDGDVYINYIKHLKLGSSSEKLYYLSKNTVSMFTLLKNIVLFVVFMIFSYVCL